MSYPKICPLILQGIFQDTPTYFQGTDPKGTKTQLTGGQIQKMAQTGMLARRATPSPSKSFATHSPSEACEYQKILGFILSPLGHGKAL